MMQKLQLSIPEPCHENWHNMTITDQGRFCNACAKEVVDFSMMTDREVLNYFSAIANEKVCGRAISSQLNRVISMPKEPKKRLFWYWNYIVMFFMFFSKANTSKAQGNLKATTELSPIKQDAANIKLSRFGGSIKARAECLAAGELLLSDLVIKNNIITGKIKNDEGDLVPFATVRLSNSLTGVSADAEGRFSIMSGNINTDSLIISGASYRSKRVVLKNYTGPHISKETKPIIITGGVMSKSKSEGLLYMVDGVKITNINEISADDIENVSLLQQSQAQVIFGSEGANGAMIITTRRSKIKNLDTAVVSATECNIRKGEIMGGMAKGVPIKRNRIADSIKTVKALFLSPSNLINIYPNPVKRGSSFALSMKLKHAGNYNIDIIDASGRILLQKQTNISSKEYIEQVQTDSRWSSGVYYIRVFDNNYKSISKLSFIVK